MANYTVVPFVASPAQRRRACLFRESCSRHVHRVAAEQGFVAACAALAKRVRQCRPGYTFAVDGNHLQMVCSDRSRVEPEDLSERLHATFVSVNVYLQAAIGAAD